MKNKLIISLIVLLLIIPSLLAASSPIISQSDFSADTNIKSNEVSSQIVEDKPDNLISDPSLDNPIENQIINDNIQELNQEEIPPIITICGNGRLEIGELCDDGNLINGDGCSSICTIEPSQEQCTEPAQRPCSRTQASWTRIWGDSGTQERGTSIEVDTSGNIYTVATTTSGYYRIEQLNTCGDPAWESVIYSADSLSVDSVAIDKCGNSYYTGTVYCCNPPHQGIFVKKYDFNGHLLWTNSYNSPLNDGRNNEYGLGIAVDNLGSVYAVGGVRTTDSQGFDIIIIKYDTDGKELWKQIFNSDFSLDDLPEAVDVDEEGNVYVSGKINVEPTYVRFWLGKYSSEGELLWNVDWRDQEDNSMGKGIDVDNEGNILVAVYSDSPSDSPTMLVKYSPEGELLNSFSYGDKDNIYGPRNVHVDNEGKIFLTGVYIKHPIQGPSENDLWLGKFSSTFDPIYDDIMDGNGNSPSSDSLFDASTDADLNVYSIGMVGNVVGGVESLDIIVKKNKYKGI